MPNYREDFRSRLPKPNYDELTYAADRERLYPGTNGRFTDSQTEAHKQYKDLQLENQRASNAYFNGRENAINYVRGMPLEEGGYYVKTSASMTPKDHYGLKGKAQSLVGAEVAHARAREDVFTSNSMLYPSPGSQSQHYGYIEDHFGYADEAEEFAEFHDNFAADPDSSARDLYGRPVIRNARPTRDPYPGTIPPEGFYATEYGNTVPYVIKEKKPKRRQGR